MKLWLQWMKCVMELRSACSRHRNFLWMIVCLIGITTRVDFLGVSSIVRALGLKAYCYDRILDFLHSTALNIELLTQLWVKLALKIFPKPLRMNNHYVLLGDGLKVAKEGKKMPAVRILHQESQNNSKAEYIMGHSCQVIALLVGALESFFAVPLVCRIHEGVKFSNRDNKTLIDKILSMFATLNLNGPCYFVLDAYYANRKMVTGLVQKGHHLVTRVKSNAIAFYPALQIPGRKRRGRPKKYGEKIKIEHLFEDQNQFTTALSPVYGEKNVSLLYRSVKLLWRASSGTLMHYVLVAHPTRGRIVLTSSDLSAAPLDIIALYGLRHKIELTFKNALHEVGVFVYHFWMKTMKRIRRGSGNQHLHRKPKQYRDNVKRKIEAYHRYMQLGLIAQGLLQYLSCSFPQAVWSQFGSWLRTIRPGLPPSEQVTAIALRNCFPDFLADPTQCPIFRKFLFDRIDFSRTEGMRLTAYGG